MTGYCFMNLWVIIISPFKSLWRHLELNFCLNVLATSLLVWFFLFERSLDSNPESLPWQTGPLYWILPLLRIYFTEIIRQMSKNFVQWYRIDTFPYRRSLRLFNITRKLHTWLKYDTCSSGQSNFLQLLYFLTVLSQFFVREGGGGWVGGEFYLSYLTPIPLPENAWNFNSFESSSTAPGGRKYETTVLQRRASCMMKSGKN
jgi:hypothetical protein